MFRSEISPSQYLDAAREGNLKVVQKYVKNKGRINVVDAGGRTALFLATANGKVDIVKLLLPIFSPEDINAKTQSGLTAFMCAVKIIGDYLDEVTTPILQAFLAVPDMDINAGDDTTALLLAIEKNDDQIVENLIAHGARIRNGESEYAFTMVIGDTSTNTITKSNVIKCLLTAGLDINTIDNEKGNSILIWAAANDRIAITNNLLARDVDIHAANANRDTALIVAVEKGHTDIVKCLLGVSGLNVDAANAKNNTALMLAAKNGHTDIVKYLLAVSGLNVDAANAKGNTALMLATKKGHIDIVKCLLAVSGLNINAANVNGDTALMLAAKNGRDDIVKCLLAVSGLNINADDVNGNTALHWAAKNGHKAIVKLLLANDANANLKNKNKKTAEMLTGDDVIRHILMYESKTVEEKLNEYISKRDRQSKKYDSECGLFLMSHSPRENTSKLNELLGNSKDAYVIVGHNIFYIRKSIENPQEIVIKKYSIRDPRILDKVKRMLKCNAPLQENEKYRCVQKALDFDALQAITSVTGHTRVCSTSKEMQQLVDLSIQAASDNIKFVLAHLNKAEDFDDLPGLITDFSNLLAGLGGGKKLDKYAHALLNVAANMGHEAARNVVDHFPEDLDLKEKVEKELQSASSAEVVTVNKEITQVVGPQLFDQAPKDMRDTLEAKSKDSITDPTLKPRSQS